MFRCVAFNTIPLHVIVLEPGHVNVVVSSRTQSNTEAALSWTNPTGNFDKVVISCNGCTEDKTLTQKESSTTFTGLTPGMMYTFSVSVFSNTVQSSMNAISNNLTLGRTLVRFVALFQRMPSMGSTHLYWIVSSHILCLYSIIVM